jgi:hypothetical protein
MSQNIEQTEFVAIEMSRGFVTLVDTCDADLARFTWCVGQNGYVNRLKHIAVIEGKQVQENLRLHRIIMERIVNRKLVKGECVDHVNGDVRDNRRVNLRVATFAQNNQNTRRRSNNTSGYKGVSWHKQHRKWRAYINTQKYQKHLGLFDTPEEAHAAYRKAALEYFGEFARFE